MLVEEINRYAAQRNIAKLCDKYLIQRFIANYRIGIRGKKWWWPLWVQCLDSPAVNTWKLHCFVAASTNAKPMPQLEFKNFIVKNLLLASEDSLFDDSQNENDTAPEDVYRPSNLPRVTGMHAPIKTDNRRRCIVCTPKATVFICVKCNVHLHVEKVLQNIPWKQTILYLSQTKSQINLFISCKFL